MITNRTLRLVAMAAAVASLGSCSSPQPTRPVDRSATPPAELAVRAPDGTPGAELPSVGAASPATPAAAQDQLQQPTAPARDAQDASAGPVPADDRTGGEPETRPTTAAPGGSEEPWRTLGRFDYAALPLADMPPDDGLVSPIAADGETPDGSSAVELDRIGAALAGWPPGHVANPVQRVRNYLLILGVADIAQSPLERFLPQTVLVHMLSEFPPDELAQLVCWVALHPDQGELSALEDPLLLNLGAAGVDREEVRTRTYYYGVKLTRWIVGW